MKKQKKRTLLATLIKGAKKPRGSGDGSIFIVLIIVGFTILGFFYVGGFPSEKGILPVDENGVPIMPTSALQQNVITNVTQAPAAPSAAAVSGAPLSGAPQPTISR